MDIQAIQESMALHTTLYILNLKRSREYNEEILINQRQQEKHYQKQFTLKITQDTGEFGYCLFIICLLYTSPSPRDGLLSRMPSSA